VHLRQPAFAVHRGREAGAQGSETPRPAKPLSELPGGVVVNKQRQRLADNERRFRKIYRLAQKMWDDPKPMHHELIEHLHKILVVAENRERDWKRIKRQYQ
jgi:hypothetical protein